MRALACFQAVGHLAQASLFLKSTCSVSMRQCVTQVNPKVLLGLRLKLLQLQLRC